MACSLYILRHGETLFNVQHKTQGWCDSPLTVRGVEQARIAGRTLAERGLSFDRFFSSTSERCCDTMELVMEAGWGSVVPYERCRGLKEHNFGAFEGKDQFLERFPHGDFYKAYGGETDAEALARYRAALDAIAAACDGCRVLVVSHGGVNAMLFHATVPDPEPGTVPFGNCICYNYEHDGELRWVQTLVPDFSALDEEGLPPQVMWR